MITCIPDSGSMPSSNGNSENDNFEFVVNGDLTGYDFKYLITMDLSSEHMANMGLTSKTSMGTIGLYDGQFQLYTNYYIKLMLAVNGIIDWDYIGKIAGGIRFAMKLYATNDESWNPTLPETENSYLIYTASFSVNHLSVYDKISVSPYQLDMGDVESTSNFLPNTINIKFDSYNENAIFTIGCLYKNLDTKTSFKTSMLKQINTGTITQISKYDIFKTGQQPEPGNCELKFFANDFGQDCCKVTYNLKQVESPDDTPNLDVQITTTKTEWDSLPVIDYTISSTNQASAYVKIYTAGNNIMYENTLPIGNHTFSMTPEQWKSTARSNNPLNIDVSKVDSKDYVMDRAEIDLKLKVKSSTVLINGGEPIGIMESLRNIQVDVSKDNNNPLTWDNTTASMTYKIHNGSTEYITGFDPEIIGVNMPSGFSTNIIIDSVKWNALPIGTYSLTVDVYSVFYKGSSTTTFTKANPSEYINVAILNQIKDTYIATNPTILYKCTGVNSNTLDIYFNGVKSQSLIPTEGTQYTFNCGQYNYIVGTNKVEFKQGSALLHNISYIYLEEQPPEPPEDYVLTLDVPVKQYSNLTNIKVITNSTNNARLQITVTYGSNNFVEYIDIPSGQHINYYTASDINWNKIANGQSYSVVFKLIDNTDNSKFVTVSGSGTKTDDTIKISYTKSLNYTPNKMLLYTEYNIQPNSYIKVEYTNDISENGIWYDATETFLENEFFVFPRGTVVTSGYGFRMHIIGINNNIGDFVVLAK